jgi:hypothetical protein
MKTHVIYLNPNCTYPISDFEALDDQEKLYVARNENDMVVYSLADFEEAFNGEQISDLGFIYII